MKNKKIKRVMLYPGVDYQKNKVFCMLEDDVKFMSNLLQQKKRGYFKPADYIDSTHFPGEPTFLYLLLDLSKKIQKYLKYFRQKGIILR